MQVLQEDTCLYLNTLFVWANEYERPILFNLRELQTATTILIFANILGQGNSILMENVEIYVLTFLEHTILSTAGVTSAICCDCDEGLLGG